MKYWLVKSEPEVYSIDRLAKEGATWWEGVRNYQARNFMRDDMKPGDPVLFYHSNAEPPGIAGVAEVSKSAEADKTQFDKKSEYYDPKAKSDTPPWVCPEVKFVRKFARVLALDELRTQPALSKMPLLQKGQRLSVQPVSASEFELILRMADSESVACSEVPASTARATKTAGKKVAANSAGAKLPKALKSAAKTKTALKARKASKAQVSSSSKPRASSSTKSKLRISSKVPFDSSSPNKSTPFQSKPQGDSV